MFLVIIPSFLGWLMIFCLLYFAVVPSHIQDKLPETAGLLFPLIFALSGAVYFMVLTERLSFSLVVNFATAAVGIWTIRFFSKEKLLTWKRRESTDSYPCYTCILRRQNHPLHPKTFGARRPDRHDHHDGDSSSNYL